MKSPAACHSLPWWSALCVLVAPSFLGALEPARLAVDDDFYKGEALQIRLALPKALGDLRLFLCDAQGRVVALLPNDFEPSLAGEPTRRSRIFPQPSLAYEILLGEPGVHRVISVHGARGSLGEVVWPEQVPGQAGPALDAFLASLRQAGMLRREGETALSSVQFSVQAGERPAGEKLPLRDGMIDGPENPRFVPGRTRLSSTEDYRKLERWAALLRSPSHRHQTFLIEAHSRAAGSRTENLSLSEKRAEEIVRYLVKTYAIPAERLVSIGKGDFEPLPGDEDPSSPAHERVTLVLDESSSRQSLRF